MTYSSHFLQLNDAKTSKDLATVIQLDHAVDLLQHAGVDFPVKVRYAAVIWMVGFVALDYRRTRPSQ